MIISLNSAIDHLKQNKPVILFDAEGENEGDLVFPAEIINEDVIKMMMNVCKGIICQTLPEARIDELKIPIFKKKGNNITGQTNFVYPVDHINSMTGISCKDRMMIIKELINPTFNPDNIVIPGHQNLLKISAGGILERQGHTEASSELISLCGFYRSAVICELIDDDGVPRDLSSCEQFSEKFNVPIVLLSEIYDFIKNNKLVITPNLGYVKNHYKFLHGKNAVVTGGSSGIGKEVVKLLESFNCHVHSFSRSSKMDITDHEKINTFFKNNQIDILINCAGYICPEEHVSLLEWNKHFDVNVNSIVNLVSQVEKTQNKVCIINLSSPSANKVRQGWSAYAASKAALNVFVDHMAQELTNGNKIFSVSPSKTNTPMIYSVFPDISEKELIDPVDIANVIITLICKSEKLSSGLNYSIKLR